MITDINSEDRLVQQTFAEHLELALGWQSVYAYNAETFGPDGTLGRSSEREVVLLRSLRAAVERLNPDLPPEARKQAVEKLTEFDPSRSLVQHNREFYALLRGGIHVQWRDDHGLAHHALAKVIDFRNPDSNEFLAVRELKIQGMGVPYYNRRADLVCFINGLPLVFIELKAVYKNIRAGFDNNLTDYMHEFCIPHAFHHNAFLVVSNGDRARYGSITSKWEHFTQWKRNDERQKGHLEARFLLDGMLAKDRLLDIVENFILFDEGRAGGTRKIVARNHQVLGVNRAVASVMRQEELKRQFPLAERLRYRLPEPWSLRVADLNTSQTRFDRLSDLGPIPERAHPDLGRLGVFWHTQGSGKSYSMAFFAEKVRRTVKGSFTFLIITDREDLDEQIRRTFAGCGVANEQTPAAASGIELQRLLGEQHRFVFSLIHKFNQPVYEPYSLRDDIIVISDEAHRTQAGRFASNMRQALPNAAFIGFTGTPLFKNDELTRRLFGDYISRYDFKRSVEDESTVRLVYESRGEKLGLENLDLNDRIAERIEQAELDPDQNALLDKLLGQDYEVVTADDRLEKLAADFVEHCSERWESGKAMLVCIDKITCARMLKLVRPCWAAKLAHVRAELADKEFEFAAAPDPQTRDRIAAQCDRLRGQSDWMASTIIELVISEAQNEVRDFQRWGFDIVPHRVVMKTGFETPDGKRLSVEDAFKSPQHPFRVAVVCAMWLTGFDVECLSTLYIDKPMKAHTLMQAIARANRVYPGKACGVIVDYNGMLRSLRAALALYAGEPEPGPNPGDNDEGGEVGGGEGAGGGEDPGDPAAPIEELLGALLEAFDACDAHFTNLGFDPIRLVVATGFERIQALHDAVDCLYTSDEARRRFEIIARQVFNLFKALLPEPAAYAYAARRDDIETIYKKLQERRDTADVTNLLKELHRIVNEAIRAREPADDDQSGITVDLSAIDFDKLRDEFAQKAQHKHIALQSIRELIEEKLAQMLALNPERMDYNRRYQEIIADYNREKDRATVEDTMARLMVLAASLDEEQRRAAREGLSEEELALFDLLLDKEKTLTKADRERLKQASQSLLASITELLTGMHDWTKNARTQAEVKTHILDRLSWDLPRPPFTEADATALTAKVYDFIWAQTTAGRAAARFASP